VECSSSASNLSAKRPSLVARNALKKPCERYISRWGLSSKALASMPPTTARLQGQAVLPAASPATANQKPRPRRARRAAMRALRPTSPPQRNRRPTNRNTPIPKRLKHPSCFFYTGSFDRNSESTKLSQYNLSLHLYTKLNRFCPVPHVRDVKRRYLPPAWRGFRSSTHTGSVCHSFENQAPDTPHTPAPMLVE
jgi:hypothetical protein